MILIALRCYLNDITYFFFFHNYVLHILNAERLFLQILVLIFYILLELLFLFTKLMYVYLFHTEKNMYYKFTVQNFINSQ
jgi:hypothetical protein